VERYLPPVPATDKPEDEANASKSARNQWGRPGSTVVKALNQLPLMEGTVSMDTSGSGELKTIIFLTFVVVVVAIGFWNFYSKKRGVEGYYIRHVISESGMICSSDGDSCYLDSDVCRGEWGRENNFAAQTSDTIETSSAAQTAQGDGHHRL
jgi:hypothetical protein